MPKRRVYQGQSRDESLRMTDTPDSPAPRPAPRKDLPPAAQRALAEAAERRRKAEAAAKPRPRELGGREGLDPARYGDWEKKGIAVDF